MNSSEEPAAPWTFPSVRAAVSSARTLVVPTRGEYFDAGTATDLKKIYEALSARLVFEKQQTEITALFSAAAAVLVLCPAFLSLLWFSRIL